MLNVKKKNNNKKTHMYVPFKMLKALCISDKLKGTFIVGGTLKLIYCLLCVGGERAS